MAGAGGEERLILGEAAPAPANCAAAEDGVGGEAEEDFRDDVVEEFAGLFLSSPPSPTR